MWLELERDSNPVTCVSEALKKIATPSTTCPHLQNEWKKKFVSANIVENFEVTQMCSTIYFEGEPESEEIAASQPSLTIGQML